jgi:hypothetical protein
MAAIPSRLAKACISLSRRFFGASLALSGKVPIALAALSKQKLSFFWSGALHQSRRQC